MVTRLTMIKLIVVSVPRASYYFIGGEPLSKPSVLVPVADATASYW